MKKRVNSSDANGNIENVVGTFVKVDGRFAMIDSIHKFGDCIRFGVVYSDKNSWTSEIVMKDVEILPCATEEEMNAAWQSAHDYYEREIDSIKGRMAMKYEQDSRMTLETLLADAEHMMQYLKAWKASGKTKSLLTKNKQS